MDNRNPALLSIPHIIRTYIIFITLILLLPGSVAAQQYFIKTYASENGLPTRVITDACQDRDGYMWFSTYTGISKYDGFSFTNYDPSTGLPDPHYRKIRCDEKGIIWAIPFVNDKQLVYFKNNKWNLLSPPSKKMPSAYITSFDVIYKDDKPVICVGSYYGFDLYKDNVWKHFNISDKKELNIVFTVNAENGSFYLGTKIGVCQLKGESINWEINKLFNARNEAILAVKFQNLEAGGTRMWFLTLHSIGYILDNKVTILSDSFILEDLDVAHFPFIGITKNGDVIFGNNFSKYILKAPESKLIPLKVKNGFSSNGASSLYIDREENIWFTDSRGIDKISDMNLVNYYESSGMPENEVTAIIEASEGKYILGHNNRISILQDNKFSVIDFPGTKNSVTRVLDIMKDNVGNIWFSANNLGVGKLKPNSNIIQWFTFNKDMLANSVCQDNSGRIWIGTNRKLFYLEGDKIVEYELDSLLTSGLRKIFPSTNGGINAVSIDGLWHVEKEKATKFPSVDEDQQLNIFSYYRDHNGLELVGTMNGLYYINKGQITRYNKNGLKINNPVYFILQDSENYYWFGTNNGVYRWSGNGDPETFNVQNGLAGRETNRSAGYLDSKGNVWVGTDKGLSCFTPGIGLLQTPAPEVNLLYTETTKGGRFSLDQDCSINNSENTLTFHFRGISFVNEQLMIYKYKLEGYDKEWREASQEMLDKIKYIDLAPGKYRLSVMAKNYSSKWSSVVYSSEINVKPPFYLTWWFILFSTLMVFATLWVVHSMASQRLLNKTMVKEISERKLAEENLIESEQRLSFVLEGSRLGTWDWDMTTGVVNRNKFWAEMLGFLISEIEQTQLQWLNLIHPDDKAETMLALDEHLEGKTPLFEKIYRMRTRDNNYKWILDRAMITQRDSEGKPLRMSGTHTDINEKKLAEDALQKSEERLRFLLSSLPVAIYISPAQTDIDLVMITGNIKNTTGYSETEFMSRPDFWSIRLHPEDKERVVKAFRQAHNEAGLTIEYRWQTADGTYKWFHDQSIVKTNGSNREFLGVIVDIHDRKLAEQEIKDKNEQLYLINAEKDKLFSIISHDLRSPVNGFLGLTALLAEDLESLNKEQIKEITNALHNSASKVNDLLSDLLEWSRLQRGLTVFTPVSIVLKQITRDCIAVSIEQAEIKNIQIINDIPPELDVMADTHMLQIVIRNLVTNAIKFTKKHGTVRLTAIAQGKQYIRVSVSDTGIGMSDDLRLKLFKVNEKTNRKGTDGEPSSGLGLILCREFIEKQNGRIWVESEEGRGSTFHFTIPMNG